MRLRYSERRAGAWDYDDTVWPGKRTFTVSCFQWVPTADGKRLKRGRIAKWIRGATVNPQHTIDRAEAWCRAREAEERA